MLKLFLIFLTATTFGQSWWWSSQSSNSNATTPPTETVEDILSNLVVLWQNGDTVDATSNGNNLTGTHTDPEITPNSWDSETNYYTGDLVSYAGITYRALQSTISAEPSNDKFNWVIHAPQRVSSGLANIPYAFRLNCYDNFYTVPTANEFYYEGTDITFTFWISGTYNNTLFLSKGNEWNFRDNEGYLYFILGDELLYPTLNPGAPSDTLVHYAFVVSYTNDSLIVYKDGTRMSEGNGVRYALNDINDVTIGYTVGDATPDPFLFAFAQIAIYKRELTADQIAYLYNSGDGRLITP